MGYFFWFSFTVPYGRLNIKHISHSTVQKNSLTTYTRSGPTKVQMADFELSKTGLRPGIGISCKLLNPGNSWDKNRLSEIFNLENKVLQKISGMGKKCVDGKGLSRVVEAILLTC